MEPRRPRRGSLVNRSGGAAAPANRGSLVATSDGGILRLERFYPTRSLKGTVAGVADPGFGVSLARKPGSTTPATPRRYARPRDLDSLAENFARSPLSNFCRPPRPAAGEFRGLQLNNISTPCFPTSYTARSIPWPRICNRAKAFPSGAQCQRGNQTITTKVTK